MIFSYRGFIKHPLILSIKWGKLMIKQAMPLRRATLTIALGLCLAGAAHAQSVTGNIYGTGEPGSTISVQNLDTGTSRTVTVDRNGRYRASDLPNGNYKVTV